MRLNTLIASHFGQSLYSAVILLVVFISVINISRDSETQIKRVTEEYESLTKIARSIIENDLNHSNDSPLTNTMEGMSNYPRIIAIKFYDSFGNIKHDISGKLSKNPTDFQDSNIEEGIQCYDTYVSITQKIKKHDKLFGYISFVFSVESDENQLFEIILINSLALVVILFIIFLLKTSRIKTVSGIIQNMSEAFHSKNWEDNSQKSQFALCELTVKMTQTFDSIYSEYIYFLNDRERLNKQLETMNRDILSKYEFSTTDLIESNRLLLEEISERRQIEGHIKNALAEKDILLKEIHHRVKNNLQVIISLMSLQKNTITDPDLVTIFSELQNRIRAIALIHEKLYQSESLAEIDCEKYINELVRSLVETYSVSDNKVKIVVDIKTKFYLDIDKLTPFALILNELVSNALKHAFPFCRNGTIKIIGKAEEDFSINISDNGIGTNQSMEGLMKKSLGLRLVYSLVQQLQGTIKFKSGVKKGMNFQINFPIIIDKSKV